MTTIAYRDGVLAADSQTTYGASTERTFGKTVRRGAVLAGASGSSAICQRFLDWFRAGMSGDPPAMSSGDDHDATGIIVHGPHHILLLNKVGWERRRAEFYAIGSGGEIATGAMAMGASAERAVEIATQHDAYTGGPITVLSVR